jgi:hypothetical protein
LTAEGVASPEAVHARLVVLAPGATAVTLAPPPLSGAAGSELRGFSASLLPTGSLLVSGCVATPIPGWVEDLRPPVVARAHAWTAKLAEAIAGVPVELREANPQGVARVHAVAVAGDAGSRGVARVLVGFDQAGGAAVLTCGVACGLSDTARSAVADAEVERACEAAVRSAHLVGDTAPPPPGRALEAVAWAVHHPTPAATAGLSIAGVGLLALVLARRRPRSRL